MSGDRPREKRRRARTDERPHLSDLRDSGSLEQDADGVILLHREDYYDKTDDPTVPIQLDLAKNRHAGTGTLALLFEKETGIFREIVR